MKSLFKRFMSDEKGLETVEYAIILGLIVAGTIGIIAAIGVWVNGRFSAVQTDIGA
jgi:pilus assembly protein Flp/PilA